VKYTPGYANSINSDIGFLDLSTNLAQGKSFLLNTSLDRLFLKYTKGKFVGTIGRQRINWGQNYVWNPNDIFNVQNFFDFDYAEKPGSDAIRLQYYTAEASALEFAIKLNHDKQATAAAFYKFNTLGYDFQLLGGILDGEDYVFGGGFAGHIKNAGFNGEFSYFKPIENANDSASYFLFGLGSDYVFNNSLHIQGEALYQYSEKAVSATDFLSWYSGNLNVKKLSFTDFSIYGNISYPISPLINGSIACMLFPEIKGFFTGPTLNYSAGDNLELSIIAQGFSGILPDPLTNEKKRSTLFLGFLRCKLNF
jgi:hypothetical protein